MHSVREILEELLAKDPRAQEYWRQLDAKEKALPKKPPQRVTGKKPKRAGK